MPLWEKLTAETEFPDPDSVYDVVRNFIRFLGRGEDEVEISRLSGGKSGSLVLRFTVADGRSIILKIGRSRQALDEIERARRFQLTDPFGSRSYPPAPPLPPVASATGRWTGFAIYDVGSFLGSRVTPFTELVRSDPARAAVVIDMLFGMLNQRVYGPRWTFEEKSSFEWFDPKLVARVIAVDGTVRPAESPRIGERMKFWRQVAKMDQDGLEQFAFELRSVGLQSASDDRRTVVCAGGDERNERIHLQLREPLAPEQLDRWLGETVAITGVATHTRGRRYGRAFARHDLPFDREIRIEPKSYVACRGPIHGDLHDGNILVAHHDDGTLLGPMLIDFANFGDNGPLWWDYVKLEIALRGLLLGEPPDLEAVHALDALLAIVSATAAWRTPDDAALAALWNEAFPAQKDAVLPFLRLRAHALALFRTKSDDHELWLRDYTTSLHYGALLFIKYGHDLHHEATYCSLAARTSRALRHGRWFSYHEMPPVLRRGVALDMLRAFSEAPARERSAVEAAAAALHCVHSLGPDVVANALAAEEQPLDAMYTPPRVTSIAAPDLATVVVARRKIRSADVALVQYREQSRRSLGDLSKSFAYLRGRYEIPLKAKIEHEEMPSFDVLALVRGLPVCVVLGAPGSGKTTFARFRRLLNCSEAEDLPLPVVVPFSRWSEARRASGRAEESAETLESAFLRIVASELNMADDALLHTLCEAGSFLFILDGLNEILPPARPRVVAAVQRLYAAYPGNQFLVTSRTIHYRNDFPKWPVIVIEDLSEEEAKSYVRRTFRGSEGGAEQLIARLFGPQTPRSVRDLARTPMFLSMLVGYVESRGDLPRSRGTLLKYMADEALARREDGKEPEFAPQVYECALQELAYAMLQASGTERGGDESVVSISRESAMVVLEPILRDRFRHAGAEQVWNSLLETALLHGDRTGDLASFPHQAFLELYASLKLRDVLQRSPATFLDHVEHQLWQETVQLLVGYHTAESSSAIQEFLRHTPEISYALTTACLLNAEYIEEDVEHAVFGELRAVLGNPDETTVRRSAAAEALATLAARSPERAIPALLDHLRDPSVCPAAVRLLQQRIALLTDEQRQRFYSVLERFVADGDSDPELLAAAVAAIADADSTIAGATALWLIERPHGVAARARRALMQRLARTSKLPISALRAMVAADDIAVRVYATEALERRAEPLVEQDLLGIVDAVETDPALFVEVVRELAAAPDVLFRIAPERWLRLAQARRVLAETAHPGQGAGACATILRRAAAVAPDGLLIVPIIAGDGAGIGDLLPLLEQRAVRDADRQRILQKLVAESATSSEPDAASLAALIDALVSEGTNEAAQLLSALAGGASRLPLWNALRERLDRARGSGEAVASALVAAVNREPLGEREAMHAAEAMASASEERRASAWLKLLRPIAGPELERLVLRAIQRDELGPAWIALLGFHRPDHRLAHQAAQELAASLARRRGGGNVRAVLLRYGFTLLEEQDFFSATPRSRFLAAALECVDPVQQWFTSFIREEMLRNDAAPLIDFATRATDDDILLLARFLIGVRVEYGFDDLAKACAPALRRWLAAPARLGLREWSVVLHAISTLNIKAAEAPLIRMGRRFERFRADFEKDPAVLVTTHDAVAGAFHRLAQTLVDLGSTRVPSLLFSKFDRWDVEGQRESLRLLHEIGWPSGAAQQQWIAFIRQHAQRLIGDGLIDETVKLVGGLRDAPAPARAIGRAFRVVARDSSLPRAARDAADAAASLLEMNNGVLIPYEPNVVERLLGRLSGNA